NGQYAEALVSLTQAEPLHRATTASLAAPPSPLLPALTALWQAQQLRQISPAHLAFLAMTQQQLRHKEQALATPARSREMMRRPEWRQNEELRGFRDEAEALLAGRSAVPRE